MIVLANYLEPTVPIMPVWALLVLSLALQIAFLALSMACSWHNAALAAKRCGRRVIAVTTRA
jgi:hypothetical protein